MLSISKTLRIASFVISILYSGRRYYLFGRMCGGLVDDHLEWKRQLTKKKKHDTKFACKRDTQQKDERCRRRRHRRRRCRNNNNNTNNNKSVVALQYKWINIHTRSEPKKLVCSTTTIANSAV